MAWYQKKPIQIEAIQYKGGKENIAEILRFCPRVVRYSMTGQLLIPTLEGWLFVSIGDYIIRGVQGEFYPCKPDIFLSTYEEL